jgi:hypothetical protein
MAQAPQSSRIIILEGVASVAPEPEVDTGALLAALPVRDLPEVKATSGEFAAVFASADATPAHRHQTPVPEPAVIAPDPRREPTHRIPREWLEPLDAMAKRAMAGKPATRRLRWAVVGLVGAGMVIVAIALALLSSLVKQVDYSPPPAAVAPAAVPRHTVAPPTVATGGTRGDGSRTAAPKLPAPRSRPARSNEAPPQDDPEYKLLK